MLDIVYRDWEYANLALQYVALRNLAVLTNIITNMSKFQFDVESVSN